MLVLAGIELIVFIAANMGLCFGFVLKTVLIIEVFTIAEQCLHKAKAFSAPHTTTPASSWGCTRSWEGTQPGQLTPTDRRDIPYHMMSRSAYKAGGRRRQRGTFGVMAFVFPSHRYT